MANIAQHIRVTGVVQGVGFRPFVWRLACDLGLAGWVRNDACGVEMLVEGTAEQLAALSERLRSAPPPLARIDGVELQETALAGLRDFVILDSLPGQARTAIGPDTAPCAACLAELFDPADRRWRHALITCTHCGPRYSVTHCLPYDRAQTSLAPFPLCADCGREYLDPGERRFHAETNCCPHCGPRLTLLDAQGPGVEVADPIAATLERLRRGEIVAIKGVGGFQLVCDARNAVVVERLRARKGRDAKPFAVLLANAASTREFAELTPDELDLLASPERPIVLLKKHPATDAALPGVAPGLAWLGVLLPASPLHYLLFHEAAWRPAGVEWLALAQPLALVCTSANPGGEPLLTDNMRAITELSNIADAFLLHDRDIVARCDDSVMRVMRVMSGGPSFIRRARGWAPQAIKLAQVGPSVLATGGYFKNTVCVTRGDEAFVSTHVGALDNAASCAFLDETVRRLLDLLDVRPDIVAHDLHPDFYSSRFAAQFAANAGLPRIAVQHHHAHIAAVLAEHGIDEPVIGLALDGVGLGSDGGAWGGELLRVDGGRCERIGNLRPLLLPGGERAAREPWRMAAAALQALGRGDEIAARFSVQPAAAAVAQMLAHGSGNTPLTSSLGRAFDAAAGLLGVQMHNSYEAQAAMRLESLAELHGAVDPLRDGWRIGDDGSLDLRPLYRILADWDCTDASHGAALFHATLAAALADWVSQAVRRTGLATLVCGGGCFLNGLLTQRLIELLAQHDVRILLARQLPANDGGLCLGQAWVARCMAQSPSPLPRPLSRQAGEGSFEQR